MATIVIGDDDGSDDGGVIDLGEWKKQRRPAMLGVPEPPPVRRGIQALVDGDNVVVEALEDGKPVISMSFTEEKAARLVRQIQQCVNRLVVKRFKAEGRCFTSGKLVAECHCHAHQARTHWVVDGRSACGRTKGLKAAESWKGVTCWSCRNKRPRAV